MLVLFSKWKEQKVEVLATHLIFHVISVTKLTSVTLAGIIYLASKIKYSFFDMSYLSNQK